MLELFKSITTFVFDVDGVLTDGTLMLLPDGIMARRMNIKDGYALQLAIKNGYQVVIISGGVSVEVKDRLERLGVHHIFMQTQDKAAVLLDYMQRHQIKQEEVLYMGDDIPDLLVMQMAGLACCPIDAVSEIKKISHYISPFKGGEGCARDVLEQVMKLQGNWGDDVLVRAQ